MRNKFVYSCSVKICASVFNKLFKSIFCILLIVEVFSLQKSCPDAWISVSWLATGQLNMMNEAELLAQFVKFLECWMCNVQLGVVMQKNWALSVGQCQLQVLQFSVHLIHLLNVLLRCNGFAEIQKAVEDQTGSKQTTKQWPWPSLALGSTLELPFSPATELVVSHCCMKSTFHHTSQSNWEMVCFYIE